MLRSRGSFFVATMVYDGDEISKGMPTAILIGFEYTFNSLPGALIDLYFAYNWCKGFGCQINVITDIKAVNNPDNLRNAVDRKIVDKGILSFYNKVDKSVITEKQKLLDSISKIFNREIEDNKLVIYYSGHGVKESMILPDRSTIPFTELRDHILNNIASYVEVFWILDCCNPNGLHLPCKLVENRFEISPHKVDYMTQPILLITSSEPQEKSIATKAGSVFTRHLFKILTNMKASSADVIVKGKKISIPRSKNRNLRRLVSNLMSSIKGMHTGFQQTVSIYSSYMVDPVLWLWIGSDKDHDVVCDTGLSTLIIR